MDSKPADAARQTMRFITRKSKGGTIQFDPPTSRERLGAAPIQIHNRCTMEGCGKGFWSDRREIICESCKNVVAATEAVLGDTPVGDMPQGMTRLAKALLPRGGAKP